MTKLTWEDIMAVVADPNNDIWMEGINLLKYADKHASEEDKKTFVEWVNENPHKTLGQLMGLADPDDYFACAEGMSWEDFKGEVE